MGDIVSLLGFPAPVARVTTAAARLVDAVRTGDEVRMTAAYYDLDAAVEEHWDAEERYAEAMSDAGLAPVLTVLPGGLSS